MMLAVVAAVAAMASAGQVAQYAPGTQVVTVEILTAEALKKLVVASFSGPRAGVEFQLETPPPSARVPLVTMMTLTPEAREVFVAAGEVEILEVHSEDLQTMLEASFVRNEEARAASNDFFDAFRDLDEHLELMDGLAASYPQLTERFSIGQTLYGNNITGLRISGPGARDDRPAVVIVCGTHSREWMPIALCAYIMSETLERYSSDPQIAALVDEIDLYVIPILNVDGFIHTWTVDRNQRKNMRGYGDGVCFGVDLNRQHLVAWDLADSSPCSGGYRGEAPLSEPEAEALWDFINRFSDEGRLAGFLDHHSSGNMILTAAGYTPELPSDYADIIFPVAESYAFAVEEVRGTRMRYGNTYDVIYMAAGLTLDAVHELLGISLSFATELGLTQNPDPADIVPSMAEWWAGHVVYMEACAELARAKAQA